MGLIYQAVFGIMKQDIENEKFKFGDTPIYSIGLTEAIDYLPDTCWYVKTDSNVSTIAFTCTGFK